MTETIEPHPLLVRYVKTSNALWTAFDNMTELTVKMNQLSSNEWHYIMSNLEQNIFLLQRLNEKNLLKSETKICDAGIGLGSALFDLYLQSKDINGIKFTFYGIEKQTKYIEYLKENLIEFWNGELNLIEADIATSDFSNYDIVYSYSPYIEENDLFNYYTKLKNEIKPGSLIIENRESGLGLKSVLEKVKGLEKIEIDDIFIFRKI
jgi:hypothetical protein